MTPTVFVNGLEVPRKAAQWMGSGYFEVALSENEVINFRGIYI